VSVHFLRAVRAGRDRTDREALDRSLARRLVDHIEGGTTDFADAVMEVPVEVYTSADHLRRELDALFLGRPLVLCLSGSLAGPGSFVAVDLCGTPVLVTRDADGRVHALLNACRHRGVRVADGCGSARRFTCPFHAWTYDLGGTLVVGPTAAAFEGMDRAGKGLVELPVAEGYGLVVGRLRPGEPVDIDEYLGPGLAEELALLDFADWAPYGDPHIHHVGANWKVIDELRGRPEDEWGDAGRHTSYQYSLFPNTCMTFDSRHIELWQILPDGVDRSTVLHTAYMRPGLSEEDHAKLVEMAPWYLRDGRRRRGLLGGRPHRARHPHGPHAHRRVRPQRAGAPAPPPRVPGGAGHRRVTRC
jgi:nitrite reductase/ring-hydroxylating ferredoxin subunit